MPRSTPVRSCLTKEQAECAHAELALAVYSRLPRIYQLSPKETAMLDAKRATAANLVDGLRRAGELPPFRAGEPPPRPGERPADTAGTTISGRRTEHAWSRTRGS